MRNMIFMMIALVVTPTKSFHIAGSSKIVSLPLLSSSSSSSSSAALNLLYQDQQQAMLRRALTEEELLKSSNNGQGPIELLAPTPKELKSQSPRGQGFGGIGSAATKRKSTQTRGGGGGERGGHQKQRALQQANTVRQQGVIRINQALDTDRVDALRTHILAQQAVVHSIVQQQPALSTTYYGVEAARTNRCDLHLSLLQQGHGEAAVETGNGKSNPLVDSLQYLLGSQGTLRLLYEELVTTRGEFYELAGIITNPGSNRQKIHPDVPWSTESPLYVIFLAMQDVTIAMGPTLFLLNTHTEQAHTAWQQNANDERLQQGSNSRLATLEKGDAVLFDARVLHAGSGNDEIEGQTRAMLNFSFRNPAVTGDFGYKGSIMPGYTGVMNLNDVRNVLDDYCPTSNHDPFAAYGNGLLV